MTSLALFLYGVLIDYGGLVALPGWMRTERWPKLPLPWATAIVLAALFFIVLEGGFRLHRETIKKYENDIEDMRKKFAHIDGPQLWMGFDSRSGSLCFQNNGGGIAHNLTLKIPRDGSTFTSRTVAILRDDKDLTALTSPDMGHVSAATLVLKGVSKLPSFITCMDTEGRWFEYSFSVDENKPGLSFVFEGKRCLGRTKPS